MKKHFKKRIALLLSVIVLVSSNGIVVSAHSCFSSHSTEVSFFNQDNCCSKEKKKCHSKPVDENTIRKSCCNIVVTFHRLDISSQVVKTTALNFTDSFSSVLFSGSLPALRNFCSLFESKAPPLIRAGVSLLHSIHTLKI